MDKMQGRYALNLRFEGTGDAVAAFRLWLGRHAVIVTSAPPYPDHGETCVAFATLLFTWGE